MTQTELDALGAKTDELLGQYLSGIITLLEFRNAVLGLFPFHFYPSSVEGLIDPVTGLRYPVII